MEKNIDSKMIPSSDNDSSKNFNRKRFIKNVRYLLKEKKDIKLGAIEQAAGVSVGYMSRMEKSEKSADPSVEFVATAAKKLDMSIDVLLNIDLEELNPTEKYLISFLEKLISDTIHDKLEWKMEKDVEVRANGVDDCGNPEHPLFEFRYVNELDACSGYTKQKTILVFPSHSFGTDTEINGNCYYLRMKNNSKLFLMDICNQHDFNFEEKQFAKEIWMSVPGGSPKFLVSNNEIKPIGVLIDKLFGTLKNYMKHPKVQKEFRTIIDAFMQDDLDDNIDNAGSLPFF